MTIGASGQPRNIHLALQYKPTTLDAELRELPHPKGQWLPA